MTRIEKTAFNGIYKLHHNKFRDERGFFSELFRTGELKEFGFGQVVQQNISLSGRGVVRGLHLQTKPFEQSKIISVITGSVFDIALDLRPDSETYLKIFTIKLDMDSDFSLLISRGFAHGFQALEDETVILYSVDNLYSPDSERGINIFSKKLEINFPVGEKIISKRDENLPDLSEFLGKHEK